MPDDAAFDPCLCAAVRQAARHLSQHYDAALAPVDIGINQYSVLVRAQRRGACTIAALAADLVMDRSTLGHLLRPLEARGLIELGMAPDDRRRKAVVVTPAGAALVARARPLWEAAQRRFAAAYGLEAVRALRRQLDEVASLAFGPAVPADRLPPDAA
jgi:DNA-binding MarR family transcriptional regulator